MADNLGYTEGSGASIATKQLSSGAHAQLVKLGIGSTPDSTTLLPGTATEGLWMSLQEIKAGLTMTVVQPTAANLKVDASGAVVPISDNGGSITVDTPGATAPLAVRLSNGSAFLSTLPVSGSVTAVQGTAAANSGAWPILLSDGTNIVGISDVSGAKALKVDVVQSVGTGGVQADLSSLGNITAIAGLYNDSASDPTSGQAAAARITQERALHMNLRNASGAEVGLAAAPIYIAAATAPGTFPVSGAVFAKLQTAAGAAYTPGTALDVTISSTKRTRVTKKATLTASQTAQDIWQPESGKRFIVTSMYISISSAGALTVFDATDTAANGIIAGHMATGNYFLNLQSDPWRSAAEDNRLKWTTGSGTAGTLVIHGYEEADE